jgi:hypothetical protein
VLFHFAGDLADTPVERLAEEVRAALAAAAVPARVRSRLFAALVEMLQNVLHYAEPEARAGGARRRADVALGLDAEGYWVRCTNAVREVHAARLRERLEALAALGPQEVTAAFRQRLDAPAERGADPLSRGAGLGLLSMARHSSAPLQYALVRAEGAGRLDFTLRARVARLPESAR